MSIRVNRFLTLMMVGLCAFAVNIMARDVDLKPSAWPQGDLDHYSALQITNQRRHPPAHGKKGMVVGTTGALAVRSGVEALRQGGTAIDAAATTALAQIVLSAGATVSFAGKLNLVYYEAESGNVYSLNGAWDVPRGQFSGSDIPPCGTPDGRQVLVHGFMAALQSAHDRGFTIEAVSRYSSDRRPGWCIVLAIDPVTGVRKAATVSDFNGIAMAEEEGLLWRRPLRRIYLSE